MAKLSLWLPPFTPDYSGAAAVLFDLNTVTAMHDGSGCTGNYTGYDEPRWYGSKSGIFCSGLRQIDAVLGDDEKLIKKMILAAEDIHPDILGLIGSPVPMVIGTDLPGVASELENRTGIVSIGLNTTGTSYYDQGAYQAAKALMKRFVKKKATEDGKINILGALPMDYYLGEDIFDLKIEFQRNDYHVGMTFAMNYTLEQLENSASAQVNIAVSRFGYLTAQYMEKYYGIPYLAGFPAGAENWKIYLEAVKQVLETRESQIFSIPTKDEGCSKQILFIGEQIMGNAFRNALHQKGYKNVRVGCLYGMEEMLAKPGDISLKNEREIGNAVNCMDYSVVIADPFLKHYFKEMEGKSFIPFSQYAVSSKLGQETISSVLNGKFDNWYQKYFKSINH